VVARIGGDEFVVLSDNLASEVSADAFVHSLWERLHVAVAVGTGNVDVCMSIGAVLCKGPVSDDVLMKLADEALYVAKAAGRDTYRLLIRSLQSNEPAGPVEQPGNVEL
jgi:diguanylate cyclase (GGDEF)-like protein